MYIVGGVVGGASVLVLIVVVVSRRCTRRHDRRRRNLASGVDDVDGTRRVKTSRAVSAVDELTSTTHAGCAATAPPPIQLDVAPSRVQILRRVGNARFGTVFVGDVRPPLRSAASGRVIVQTLAASSRRR